MNKLIVIPVIALAAGISLAACGTASPTQVAAAPAVTHTVAPKTAAPKPAPKVTHSAPAKPAAAKPAAPTQTVSDWCTFSVLADMGRVASDLTQLQTDTGNGMMGSAETDGATLSQDANSLVNDGMPPMSQAHVFYYHLYLSELTLALAFHPGCSADGALTVKGAPELGR